MLPYLTPARYRTMGRGTTDQDDETLLSLISQASLAVDRFCSVPMTPSRYSFRGGVIEEEEHLFRLGNGLNERPSTQIWPLCTPLRSVSKMRIYLTNAQYVEFAPSELFVTRRNVNITSLALTSVGLFGNVFYPIMGLTEPVCRISYEYGWDFASGEEVLGTVDRQTYRAQNQFWSDAEATVKKDGTVITSGFAIDRHEGTVIMEAVQAEGTIITASYRYPLPAEVPQAVSLAVVKYIGDMEIAERGMVGVESIRVGEIEITRPGRRAQESTHSMDLPPDAKQLLTGLQFMSIR